MALAIAKRAAGSCLTSSAFVRTGEFFRIDGKNVRTCQETAVDFDGKSLTTIEGLAAGEVLHPVQEAFIAERAMQCGYCVPGMILTTVALLKKYPKPTEQQVIAFMGGNLCRCNNYVNILRAIRRAAGQGEPQTGSATTEAARS